MGWTVGKMWLRLSPEALHFYKWRSGSRLSQLYEIMRRSRVTSREKICFNCSVVGRMGEEGILNEAGWSSLTGDLICHSRKDSEWQSWRRWFCALRNWVPQSSLLYIFMFICLLMDLQKSTNYFARTDGCRCLWDLGLWLLYFFGKSSSMLLR